MISLTGECDGCGSANGVLISTGVGGGTDYHCAACIQGMALYDAAEEHMELLIGQALSAWTLAWGNNPQMMGVLSDMFAHAAIRIQQADQ